MRKIIIACILAVGLSACSDDGQDDFPSVTTGGAHTFAFKIDGANWVAPGDDAGGLFDPGPQITASVRREKNGRISIAVGADRHLKSGGKSHVTIAIDSFAGETEYLLSDPDSFVTGYFRNGSKYHSTSAKPGRVSILRFDTTKQVKVISGIFEFEGRSSAGTVQITEGRFDLRFLYIGE